MSSTAYGRFAGSIHRAWKMANLRHGLIENQVIIGDGDLSDYDDLGRASIVLAVAAMDSYFTEAFVEKLVPYLRANRPSKGLVEILERSGFGMADALQLLNQWNPWLRVQSSLERALERYVTQSFDKIDRLFVAYGYKNLCTHAANRTKRKLVKQEVKHLVERRHQIVHDGDYYKNNKLRKFSQKTTTKEIRALEVFVAACDEILFP